jgi:transposase InsO family protein
MAQENNDGTKGSIALPREHAKKIIEERQYDYNNYRRQSAFDRLTPLEFAAQFEENLQLHVLQ